MKKLDSVERWIAVKEDEVHRTDLKKGLRYIKKSIAKNEELNWRLEDHEGLFDILRL